MLQFTNYNKTIYLKRILKMIEIKNVDFKYKTSNDKILNNINLNINDGEFVALVGKNGSR